MKKNDEKYIPINCDFYDELELLALRGRSVHILYKSDDGENVDLWGRIKTFYIKNKVEFMALHNTNLEIRMDRIVEVDGKAIADY